MNKDIYDKAITHQIEHRCGAHVYEDGEKLNEALKEYKPKTILEIGTGVGYTAAIMALALPDSKIITLEKDSEHAKLAQDLFYEYNLENQITIIREPAEDYLPNIDTQFDFIFFDGFQIHYQFLGFYERLLKTGGILFLANNHLQSRTSEKFFQELNKNGNWQILEKFADTTVAKRN